MKVGVGVRVVVLVATLIIWGCGGSGGEGEPCKSNGIFTPYFCNAGLVCNSGRKSPTCEKPKINPVGGPCAGDDNCAGDLWCNFINVCAVPLTEGQPCNGPGCAVGLQCVRNAGTSTASCQPEAAP